MLEGDSGVQVRMDDRNSGGATISRPKLLAFSNRDEDHREDQPSRSREQSLCLAYKPGGSSPSKCGSYPEKRRLSNRLASEMIASGARGRSTFRKSISPLIASHFFGKLVLFRFGSGFGTQLLSCLRGTAANDAVSPRGSEPQQGRRSSRCTGERGPVAGDGRAAEIATHACFLCCRSPSRTSRSCCYTSCSGIRDPAAHPAQHRT